MTAGVSNAGLGIVKIDTAKSDAIAKVKSLLAMAANLNKIS